MYADTNLKGVIAAVVTPLDDHFDVDSPRLAAHCRRMLDAGCSYTSIFGTTGEGASLSTDQKLAAMESLSAAGADMTRLIPGVMSSKLDDAARLLAGIAGHGCRAALVMPPYYYEPSGHEGVADYYQALVERAGTPDIDIVLYNFPRFSGITFTPELVRAVIGKLGKQIAGIKDSTGNLESGLTLISEFPNLSIFTGSDVVVARLVEAGGAGMIGGIPNLYPEDCVRLGQGGVDEAFQKRATGRIEVIDQNGGLAPVKALLAEQLGEPSFARLVPPLRGLSKEATAKVASDLAALGTL